MKTEIEGLWCDWLPEWVCSSLEDMMDRYMAPRSYVVLDFEIDTSHGDFGHPVWPKNQMLLACWTVVWPDGTREEKVQWGNEYAMEELVRDVEQTDLLIAHQAKYELGWLKRCGLDLHKVLVFDTKIAEYVLTGNLVSLTGFSTSLDDCCKRRGWPPKDPAVDRLMKDGINPVRMPRSWLQGRCELDVKSTEKLFFDQRESLDRQGMLQVQYTRCLLTPVLADIEFNGMTLDPERVRKAYEDEVNRNAKAKEELDKIAQINWNSDPQKAAFIYGELGFEEVTNKKGEPIRTDGGKPKTDGDTLLALGAKTAEQKKFMKWYKEFNESEAALSKSLEFFKGVVEEHGGVFYAEFNQTVTATHRLSSSGMGMWIELFEKVKKAQFQNLANRFKNLFTSGRKDFLFTEWDGSGLEFRGAGLLAGDPMIMNDINTGRDPHAFSGSVINGISYEEFMERKADKDEQVLTWRKKAKAHTFKPLFGGQSGTAAERRYYKAFNERYAALATAQEQWAYGVLGKKYHRTPWGLVFRFPYARMDKDGYINVKTNVYNYPIQSISTAEIIPLAVVAFWHYIHYWGLEEQIIMVNTVHDSVLSEVHKDALEEYKELAQQVWHFVYWYFENVYGFPLKGLPLGTEITWGSHWSEGEEEAFNIHQDGRIEAA